MTTDPVQPPIAADGHDSLAALTQELTDLDYTGGDVNDGIVTYAHPDGNGVLATIDHVRQHVRLSRRNEVGDATWTMRLTADTPPEVQIITLYLVLHAGIGDRTALIRSVADALDVPLGTA